VFRWQQNAANSCAEGDSGGEEKEEIGRGVDYGYVAGESANVQKLAAAEREGRERARLTRTGTAAAEDNRRHGHDRGPYQMARAGPRVWSGWR